MFYTIARFELRYQMGNPVFWVAAIMFFLLTFGATTAESIRLGSGGNIHTNAPTAIAQIQLIMSLFFMFVTTAFVGNVVVRDDETGFGGIIRSTKVGKLPYMFGRFSGAFLGAALAFLAVPLAIWIGTFMPWINPDFLGPNRLQDYLWAYFVLALPNLLITSAIFFAVACWTRSVTYSYLMVILFMFAYFALSAMLRKWPDLTFAAYLEPFGTVAYGLGIRYLTPIQANTQALELSGLLLGNRLAWLAISAAIVVVAVWRFRFAERGITKSNTKREAAREQKLAAIKPTIVAQLPANMPERAAWHQLWTRTRFEMKLVFKSPAFWVLALVGALNLLSTLNLAGRFYGVPMWPRTFAIVDVVLGTSILITLLMAIYFSGEVVWRERERRFSEILDATPLPNWVFLISKLAGVVGALLVLCVAVVLLESILFQFARGLTDIEFGQWLAWFVAPGTLYVIQISVLSIVVQAVSPNKFVGWGIMLLYLVAGTVFAGMGLHHPLLNYAEVTVPLSDMNGANYGGATGAWMRIYWTVFAVILVVIGHLMWRRGTAVTIKSQWRSLPARLRGKPLAFLSSALLVTIGMAGFLYYNMNVLNHFGSKDEEENRTARYEKEYSKYLGLAQPTLTDIKLDVDLQPSRRFAQFDGTYHFVNATAAPIASLHVRMLAPMAQWKTLSVPGAKLVHDDDENKHRIYQFDEPLQPGASGTLTFRTVMEKRGLATLPSDKRVYELDAQPAPNGAYLTSLGFAPALGMNRSGFLQGNNLRRKHGLEPELPTPPLEDEAALAWSYVGVDRVNTDITVTTDADQTLVVTGAQVSDNVANGRRTARFVSPIPTLNFITIQSARYDVKTADADGVKISVYHFPKHPWNIDRMLAVMSDALDYYRKNYGPYQYSYARIIERPDYGGGANSAPGTVGYSEKAGFTMDLRDPKRLDFLGYVTAHELAHQYWFHQVMPADVQGAEVLTETLSQYSALMVMKHRYGPDQIRQFLKYELDYYLQGRRQEAAEEQPLARVNKQGYIHYNKGSIVMYLIQDRLGEERVNTVLRSLVDRYRFKAAPYARSSDLVDGLLALARTPAERELILDQFYRITLYDLRVKQASVRQLPDGQYETTLSIDAAKTYADGKGNETKAELDEQVDVGVFTAQPSDLGFGSNNVLSMQRLPIRSGEQQVRLVTKDKPVYAGVDPYLTFIDRNANDNIVSVSGSAPVQDAVDETARINAWFDAKYEEQLDLSPIERGYAGEKKDHDKIDDMSEAARDRALEWQRKSVEELKAKFDRAKLQPDAQLSYDLWIYQYEDAASLARFKRNEYVFNQLYGPHTRIPQFLMQIHRVDEPADMDAYIARIGGVARAQLQLLDIAKQNAAAGSRVPRFSYEAMIPQARALITGAPFAGEGDSAVWTDVQAKVDALIKAGKIDSVKADGYKAAARKVLLDQWQPAYDQLIAWFESELPKADTIATGVGKNPNGKAFYEAVLANSTTTTLTAQQVHQIGLDEVARIKGEMEQIKQTVGFKGTLHEFFKFVRDDDRFYYPNTDEGRQAYIDAATAHVAFMKQQLPKYFGILPKADVIVKRVEAYREVAGAPQHYFMSTPDGSRPGVFYAHLLDMRAMPIPQLEVITYHEALPGHHMNFAIARELTDIPNFRKYLYFNAYQEGWGLYTEKLAKQMGAYQDPYSDFGRLTTELWRAIRLVVDTGLHSKGWTEEQSVKYFSANSPAAAGQIRAEVQRYIIMPGQATGYKIGMIKMEQLRQRAQDQLGSKFDIRGFHDTILGRGQMPLDLLDQRVNRWIADQQAR